LHFQLAHESPIRHYRVIEKIGADKDCDLKETYNDEVPKSSRLWNA
jgi:hypothetical protein